MRPDRILRFEEWQQEMSQRKKLCMGTLCYPYQGDPKCVECYEDYVQRCLPKGGNHEHS